MISVVMPYWQRGAALHKTLRSFADLYQGLNLEVVVVDDGSPTDPARLVTDQFRPWIRLIELPLKSGIKNPCVPINVGVRESRGNVLLLTSPEVYHPQPILIEALREHEQRGPMSVVVMAVWAEHTRGWYSHSQHAHSRYHFCNMLSRQAFEAAGGFDEEYRDGYCFDDPDFYERLCKAGVEWVDRDDLVAVHAGVSSTPYTRSKEDWKRNFDLFVSKWGFEPRGVH